MIKLKAELLGSRRGSQLSGMKISVCQTCHRDMKNFFAQVDNISALN